MSLIAEPHHDGSPLYVSDANPRIGDVVEVTLLVPAAALTGAPVTAVHVRYTPDAEATFVPAHLSATDEWGQWWAASLPVHNRITSYRFLVEGGPWGYALVNGTGVHLRDVPDAADFRIVGRCAGDPPPAPAWAQDSIVYQVFPDRFARSWARDAAAEAGEHGGHGYAVPDWARPARWDEPVVDGPDGGSQLYGGDLDGLREHLDHLTRVGADVLYLTPIFPGRSNHRYDASTFDRVDPVLGGDEALARLTAEAHARGIRVMGDITLNHTGSGHPWFRAALTDPDSPERGFYFIDAAAGDTAGDAGTPVMSPWPALPDPDLEELVAAGTAVPGYVGWLGTGSLPKLNYDAPQLWDRLFDDKGVIQRWLAPPYGLDGWRVDVANMTGRQGSQDHNHKVARRTRLAMSAAHPDTLLVGEHTHDFSRDVPGDGWHGVMNYAGFIRPAWTWFHAPQTAPNFLGSPLKVPKLPGSLVAETIREFSALVPWTVLTHCFTLLGSHDTSRIRTLVGEDEDGASVAVAAAALLLTSPGIPMIPYGDEVGLRGLTGEDGRRPMLWDESAWETELFTAYERLAAARRAHVALRRGGMRWIHAGPDALVYLREHRDQVVLVHVARQAHEPVTIPLSCLPGVEGATLVHGVAPRTSNGMLELTADAPGASIVSWTPRGRSHP